MNIQFHQNDVVKFIILNILNIGNTVETRSDSREIVRNKFIDIHSIN